MNVWICIPLNVIPLEIGGYNILQNVSFDDERTTAVLLLADHPDLFPFVDALLHTTIFDLFAFGMSQQSNQLLV